MWANELAAKIRPMKDFGFPGCDNVIYIDTNGKMPEVSAAMSLTNLESLDEFIAINRHVLIMPNGTAVGSKEIRSNCKILHFALQNADATCRRLPAVLPFNGVS